MNTKLLCAITALLVSVGPAQQASAADVIQQWNQALSETLKADLTYQNPGMASRSLAMTNIAMYDALNSVVSSHEPFYVHAKPPENTSAEAAVLQAGYRVLSSIYPDQQALLDSHRESILATIPSSTSRTSGIVFGNTVGNKVVQERMNDGYMDMVGYMPSNEVGHWQPDPTNPTQMAWGPEWGQLKAFVVTNSADIMPPPMPSLTSVEYTNAFNEVKELGAVDSATRTADQTEAGLFWAYDRLGMGTPMRLYIDVLDTVSTQEENTLTENANLYAMAATSIADAGIVAWDAKFEYDFWRPVSGIRLADEDDNPDTIADKVWTPLGSPGGVHPEDGSTINDFTPPFPTYISGHASFGGALFHAIETFYGTDDIAFSLESEELPGVTRSFDSLSEAMIENGRSRVYLGIHWDFDDFMARNVGSMVADEVMSSRFESVPEPSGFALLAFAGLLMVRGTAASRRR